MEEIILTKIYHGGILSDISVPTYVGNCVSALRYIIKDHFFILELLHYTKELGYETVGGIYVKDLLNKKWVLITTDQHLLHLIKDLKHKDTFEVFVCHVLDEPLLDTEGPRGYLTNVGGEGVDVDLSEKGEAINLGGEGEAVDLSGEGEAINLGGEGVDVNTGEDGVDDNLGRVGVDDNLGGEGESDFLSSDSDLDMPSEDGSAIDEELRAFRQERKNKKQRKKATEFEEMPVGEAGGIDRGFEDIGKNKIDKYAEKLGRDEDYIDSSDCWSDDSDEQLDVDVVRGVDILARRRSKKVRAKHRIMKEDMGDWNVEFARLCDYVDMIKQTNPGSSCWKGEERRKQFWRCSKASFEVKFGEEVHAMSKLAARHKSIITMLEDIRHKMMNRHIDIIKFAETWISNIAPMARAILERNKEYSNNYNVQWNGLNGFEISEGEYSFVVDLEKKHCDCRLWMLRGIPYLHVICAYYYLNQDPDQHVEHWYKKETFLRAYNYFIRLIPNMKMWPETTNP
ncbi:hypothetical protein H5410_032599 [Solanum commersonii]|uniref:SWIM-type domain-containing protein n=1 Tax=Solanum commersonii TaxID=4109 RepID=A0A9J5YMP5_SOLCO|nr:hypothetical protein H5410_032599 [Solanum commersonii]